MKRRMTMLLCAMLCMLACAALAADYGRAIIDGRNSYKVHLRAEPSSKSDSMGIYFTGTKVKLKSDPDETWINGEWIEVEIGRVNGYMKGIYLKRGEAADRVTQKFWSGTVDATRYARMRYGPSTEYQFLRNMNDGESVTIMGETENHWYYVEYKGDKGFISANLIDTNGRVIESGVPVEEEEAPDDMSLLSWQGAYRAYVVQHGDADDTFALIHVNDDSVPELVIDSGYEAGGCRILTYAQGEVNVLTTRRRGFTYIERGNRLCNSDGLMDQYYDDVYEIRNGRWVCIARGEYFGYLSGWNDILGRYVCKNYVWNGQKTDIGQYMINLSNVYDMQRASGVEDGYSLAGMINRLTEAAY